ncbi:unnamed protein product [Plutella xylostella]|uniref:Endoplasmic reticulum lectin 1 n=1 Tax=Plutella xylostella TaxID=51655 RepID=A0A8S4EXB2_PLUXY|nr:unnamed protein product [Plutella xylostella]
MQATWLLIALVLKAVSCIEHDFKGFDDSILFSINWPGSQESIDNLVDGGSNEANKEKDVIQIVTKDKESYECQIPEVIVNESVNIGDYDGLSPMQLLKPLFSQKICSYRLESYWSYEVCHGRYIRQYHEERDGKHIITQEYYLGHWTVEKQKEFETATASTPGTEEKPRLTKVDGVSLPYVEMVMEHGTFCDLSGKRRLTRIQYVCYSPGKHEVYSFKETSTCEYEIIVLSPLLCRHPQFKPKETSENVINCLPIGESPKKPKSLLELEAEALRLQHQTVRLPSDSDGKEPVLAVVKVQKVEKDGETHLTFELHSLSEDEATEDPGKALPKLPDASAPAAGALDDSPVRAFLNGKNCLNGGSGWWKYEFCYGKHVSQYHVDRAGASTVVTLGTFDPQAHRDWLRENKAKAPKPLDQRTSISHLYSNGDICDKTGKPRQTEVKLKCLENSSSSAQVSLYLLEPRTCHYILGVESPLICDILPYADEYGLINMAKTMPIKETEEVYEDKEEEEEVLAKKDIFILGND